MSKLFWLAALGGGGLWLYGKYKSQPTNATLPADAVAVQNNIVAGVPVTIFLASSGYYAQYPSTGGQTKTIGPYSQAQVNAMLNAKNAVSSLLGSL